MQRYLLAVFRGYLLPAAFAALAVSPFFFFRPAADRPRHVRCRLGTSIICDYWSTNPVGIGVEWSTNIGPGGFVYISRQVPVRLW